MKKSIALILLSLLLLFAAYDRDSIINELSIYESKIDSLENTFSRHTISIGDTTMQIIRDLKIQDTTNSILDIRRIDPGKNIYYVELNNKTGLDIIYMK